MFLFLSIQKNTQMYNEHAIKQKDDEKLDKGILTI